MQSDTPLFVVRVEQCEKELPYCVPADTLLLIVGKCKLGILSLGELSLALSVHFHKSCRVAVYGLFPAERTEQLNVHWKGGYPLLAAYYVC